MDIDVIESKEKRETRKYFKYGKESHIRRFCRAKQKEVTLAIFDTSENEEVLRQERNQDSEI